MSEKSKWNFSELNELASEKNGGKVIFATDEWFAAADNLLKDDEPVWKEGIYTNYGKWMDGWETRRKRCAGHDWAIIALNSPSIIKGFCVDTAYFTGNYAPRVSIQAAQLYENELKLFPVRSASFKAGVAASKDNLTQIESLRTDEWTTILPMSKLEAGYESTRRNYFPAFNSHQSWTHLRLNLYPDGGIARLRVYGRIVPPLRIPKFISELVDLIARENGGVCEKYSNAHYGHPRNLIKNENGVGMFDGWETARRLDRPAIIQVDNSGILQIPGEEWAIFKLGYVGLIEKIIIDTFHFKGNFPDNVKIEVQMVEYQD
ncbi:allantoicase-like isoform X2 [Chelonus insularis]|uniref:allantoicase-like isoform X2 n=1 Tax=Chelonus insularis TaxID=460826 RepID=UPI00158B7DE9|nr:allantoicase-like isoform X2 [Chelonus insularis]